MQKRVYLDNAATTPLRDEVLEAMLPYLKQNFGNPSSIHQEGRVTRSAIEQARKTIAQLIGASTSEIFFTSGGTESNNMAIKCAVQDLGIRRIISTRTEHHCVKHAVEAVHARGLVEVVYLDVDSKCLPDLVQLENLLKQESTPTLVTLMHANNEVGAILDLKKVSDLCKTYNARLHTDTVQTFGHYRINVQEFQVDFLSGAAHKFHGPKGVGFIYINSGCQIKPLIDGGSQERNMRAGTENIAGIVGIAKAAQLAYHELEEDAAGIQEVKLYMFSRLKEICQDVYVNGDINTDLYTVLNVSFPAGDYADMLIMSLDIAGIAASSGSACSSGAETQSHVLQAIGHPVERKAVRFSFSRYTTKEEVDYTIKQLEGILAGGVPVLS